MAEERTKVLSGGSFYGTVQSRREQCGAIFSDLHHPCARELPAHSHELPFFALLLDGDYRERYCRQQMQFGPFTVSYRPAGVPHEDEIGPRGVRFFEIEILPSWRQRLRDCSGTLDVACDDCTGGDLLWLGMKLFRETRGPEAGDLCIESLLAELLAAIGRLPRETAKDAPRCLGRILDKLRTEYCERLTLDELSKEAGVHSVHLSRIFRKHMREGIGEYVHRLRIREACQQILATEFSLADIAVGTGFADQGHFTRAFGRITGMTPGRFRMLLASGLAIPRV